MQNFGSQFSTVKTPQSEPIPGTNQVKMRSGGYGFAVDARGRGATARSPRARGGRKGPGC